MTVAIRRFDSATELASLAQPFLMRNEAHHNLLLGLLANLETASDFYDCVPYYAAVVDGGDVIAAALLTPPHPVVISLCESEEALRLLAADLLLFEPKLSGVNAPVPVGVRFAEAWRRLSAGSYRLSLAERAYKLERLKPPAGVSGRARFATEADLDLLVEWRLEFVTEALPHEQALAEDLAPFVKRGFEMPPELRGTFIWEDPLPVSMVAYGGPTPNSLRIGPVYTPPRFRRRGYASACTAAACRYILDSGRAFCTLFADLANPTSNHIYQDLGFEPVVDMDAYLFDY